MSLKRNITYVKFSQCITSEAVFRRHKQYLLYFRLTSTFTSKNFVNREHKRVTKCMDQFSDVHNLSESNGTSSGFLRPVG
jgi:hypothetical protein